ncbi:MAG TPA: quinolinate synthase NadA [Salinimicrobium sp.]|nr:quinolinate synthase NadA [Salinimicrobium sp.]
MKTDVIVNQDLQQKVIDLKKEKNAVILAHYYQEPAIQEVADFVGDSLELSKKAAQTDAEIIVFAGVHFMAETAKILNPNKKVLLPDMKAGCSLADGCPPDAFREFKKKYTDHVVVTYINCSAEIKTMSDIVCTSSNAQRIINSIPKEQPIIFAPDKNLGKYLIEQTGRDMVLWEGSCIVHEAFSIEKLIDLYRKHPEAVIVAHPESETHILKTAQYVGSTSGIREYVKNSDKNTFIVATEAGILHQMQKDVPHKTLIPAPAKEDNTCACSECAFMKLNTLDKLYKCLKNETPEIILDKQLMAEARISIERMMALS